MLTDIDRYFKNVYVHREAKEEGINGKGNFT